MSRKVVENHVCNPPQFHLIVDYAMEKETIEDDLRLDDILPPNEPHDNTNHPEFLAVSPAAIHGLASPRTLRITGYVKGQPISVLIDSGSTHNIIQPRVASFLNLHVQAIPEFPVMIGNGAFIHGNGICRDTPVKLQNTSFQIPFFVLPIQGADLVLGVAWLGSLGKIIADFSVPSMEFIHNGKSVVLTGEPSHSLASSSTMHTLLHHHKTSIASMHTITLIPPTNSHQLDEAHSPPPQTHDPRENHNPLFDQLITQYGHIFDTPTSLPPQRNQDHHIHLKQDADPVNVRPYRYPHYQKEVVAKLITDMLRDGIIKPSTSPYSSPVLLVRKKDGTWRFCVDYRALNAITIRDRFPIPTVDELLDELHGAQIFSKLDLRAGYHQIRVAPEDTHKTAFRTTDGHYEFLVMPFGLSNAPSSFQAAMNEIFRPVLRRFVLVFFDDILVFSKTEQEHHEHLQQVFDTLSRLSYFAKYSKCILMGFWGIYQSHFKP